MSIRSRMKLPDQVHESSGNAKIAIERTADIQKYVLKAIEYLNQSQDDKNGSFIRAGYLRQGDELLDTIIRFANCAKDELRIAYCPTFTE